MRDCEKDDGFIILRLFLSFLPLGLLVVIFLLSNTSPVSAADRNWLESQKKAGLEVEPQGWYRMKYLHNSYEAGEALLRKPQTGYRAVGILVAVTNTGSDDYYFATKSRYTRFYAGGFVFRAETVPNGYDLGINCNGSRSVLLEPDQTINCLYLLELPWAISEVRMAVPFPQGKSRGIWSINVTDKLSYGYLGFKQRSWHAGWEDPHSGNRLRLQPEAWWELTNEDIRRLPTSLRPPPGKTVYTIRLSADTSQTLSMDRQDFEALNYKGQNLEVIRPSSRNDCRIKSSSSKASCSVLIRGPKNMKSIHLHYDFGSSLGYWKLKLDRDSDYYRV